MRKLKGRKIKRQKRFIIFITIILMTIFASGYAAFSTKIKLNAKGNIKTYKVTFDPNGGILDITSKRVVKGDTYGTLPTPSREGYTFKGWNGKNKLDLSKYVGENEYYKVTDDYIKIIKTDQLSSYSTRNGLIDLIGGNVYSISADISGAFSQRIYAFFGTSFYFNSVTNGRAKIQNITYSSTDDKGRLQIMQNNNSNTSIILQTDEVLITNIQVEEGDKATDYEPYYVTSETEVTQEQNHTLTAIWEENEP